MVLWKGKSLVAKGLECHCFSYSDIDSFTALKWGSYAELQLSAEEVIQLAELLGFDVDHSSRQSIDSVYAEPPDTSLKLTYGKCVASVRQARMSQLIRG